LIEKGWDLVLEENNHCIELKHDWFLGKRIISLDGKVIEYKKYNLFDRGSKHSFNVGNHNCIITIVVNGFSFKYDLIVDNISLETGERIDVDKELKIKMDEWKRIQVKGKTSYVIVNGLINGIFQGLLFGFVVSFLQGKEALKFYLIFGIFTFVLLGIIENLFRWNKYKKMFDKTDHL